MTKRIFLAISSAGLAMLVGAAPAAGQAAAGAGADSANGAEGYVLTRINSEARRTVSDGSPNSRAAAGSYASNIQFTNESGDSSVSLAMSIDLEGYKPVKQENGFYSVSRTRIGFVATAPIDESGKDTALFQGDSLVSGTKLRLTISRFSTRVGSGLNAAPAIGEAYGHCVRTEAQNWANAQADQAAAIVQAQPYFGEIPLKINSMRGYADPAMVMSKDQRESPIGAYIIQQCRPNPNSKLKNTGDLVAAYGPSPQEFRSRFLPKDAHLTFMGLDASMGRDDHSFLDRTSFKLLSEPRTSWEVGAYYGIIGSDLSWSLRARAVYGQSYKDKDEAEICRTVSIPAGDECIKGPDGAPIRERAGLVSVEGRKLLALNDKTSIALAPQVTYRFEDKNLGIEVPVYMVPGEDGKLTGGIKAAYNSKGDEFGIGLFVGIPFSVFFD